MRCIIFLYQIVNLEPKFKEKQLYNFIYTQAGTL